MKNRYGFNFPCRHVACPNQSNDTTSFCDAHSHEAPKPFESLQKSIVAKVNAPTEYNTIRWKKFRKDFLLRHPVCSCGAKATTVHHSAMSARQMMAAFGHFVYEEGMYEPKCKACNMLFWARYEREVNKATRRRDH